MISHRLFDSPSTALLTFAPPSAADRIEHRPFLTLMKSEWNSQVETLFRSIGSLNHKAVEWSKERLYGGEVGEK